MLASIYRLRCGVQHYAWGSRWQQGRPPYIAQLLGTATPDAQPYAELWVGAHPKLPALVQSATAQPIALDAFIAANQRPILGDQLVDAGYKTLPFLLKILSSAKPLSIQAHPDRALASTLHQRDPDHYPDSNHKPEIAISLQGLNALCQFRPLPDINADRQRLRSLHAFFAAVHDPASLQAAYARIFQRSAPEIARLLAAVATDIAALETPTAQDQLFQRLLDAYPGDRGTLSAYFLNEINLQPGQAVFLGPNQPHSYLSGTIIECMANSDNVVRAGLTDKFIDQDVLLDMLTYETGQPQVLQAEPTTDGEVIYAVPVADFQVRRWFGGTAATGRQVHNHGLVSLLLVLDGQMTITDCHNQDFAAERGSAWLWPAATDTLHIQLSSDADVVWARPNLTDQ